MNKKDALAKCIAIRDYLTSGNPIWGKDEVDEAMTMAIEALSVDLVRCGECKHESYCCRNLRPEGHLSDDYCSYGERRSDETD